MIDASAASRKFRVSWANFALNGYIVGLSLYAFWSGWTSVDPPWHHKPYGWIYPALGIPLLLALLSAPIQ
jgi:TRAP-type C4-dicarboxylate transport system permease small subunit